MSAPGPATFARRLTVGASLATALLLGGLAARAPARVDAELVAARGTGWAALTFLWASLATAPLLALAGPTRAALVVALRRGLGLAAAGFGVVHLALTLATNLAPDVTLLLLEPQERAGLGALVTLLALALTSFPAVLRALRVRAWKELHRLVYLAALLAVLHVALSSMASVRLLLAVTVALAALFAARLVRAAGRGVQRPPPR